MVEQGKELTDAELDQLAKQRFECKKKFVDLQAKFYDKFRKDLSARQVQKVLQLEESRDHHPVMRHHRPAPVIEPR